MMLKKGINIKILKKSTKGDRELFGKIIGIYKNYMVVNVMDKKREKYLWNECFNVADIIDPYALEFLIKQDKIWTDRTSNAKNSIQGGYGWRGTDMVVTLSGNVSYFVFLELAMAKKYSVLVPTMHAMSTDILSGYKKVIG